MTDNLVNQIMDDRERGFQSVWSPTLPELQARILANAEAKALHEAIKARVARLEGVLRQYVYETTHLSPEEDDGSHWCKISKDCLETARTALDQTDAEAEFGGE